MPESQEVPMVETKTKKRHKGPAAAAIGARMLAAAAVGAVSGIANEGVNQAWAGNVAVTPTPENPQNPLNIRLKDAQATAIPSREQLKIAEQIAELERTNRQNEARAKELLATKTPASGLPTLTPTPKPTEGYVKAAENLARAARAESVALEQEKEKINTQNTAAALKDELAKVKASLQSKSYEDMARVQADSEAGLRQRVLDKQQKEEPNNLGTFLAGAITAGILGGLGALGIRRRRIGRTPVVPENQVRNTRPSNRLPDQGSEENQPVAEPVTPPAAFESRRLLEPKKW